MTSDSTPDRRVWVRRGIIAFLVAANIVIFGALAAILFAANTVASSIDTVASEGLALTATPPRPGEPRTFLLVGSDSRDSVAEEDLGTYGRFGGQRADVIMLLQVLPDEGRMQLLSIPRDLRVEIDGRVMKINAAFNESAAAISRAVSVATDVPIDHYLQVDFAGFAGIVDAIGGVEMTFPNPVRDRKSKLRLDAGTHVIDGETAIALARSRFYQEQRDGAWTYVEASDIGRTGRQRALLLSMFTQIDRPSSIGGFGDLVDALGGFVLTDDRFDGGQIIETAWQLRSLDATDVDSLTLPVREHAEGGVSYVIPASGADEVLEAFRSAVAIGAIVDEPVIEVRNGNGRVGAAAAVAAGLEASGFDVAETTNADRDDHPVTRLVARPTAVASAHRIRAALGYGDVVAGSVPVGVDVLVIVGLDAPMP